MELAGGWTVGRLVDCELTELDRVLEDLVARDDYEPIRDVVATLVARMRGTLRHLIDIGVGYLSLNPRRADAVRRRGPAGEDGPRQLDCDLVDLIYILDEPTVGLHPRDIDHLIVMLHRLRDHGNSVRRRPPRDQPYRALSDRTADTRGAMTEGRLRPGARVVVRALLAALIGMLAGGGLNAALGEQGADTPALALLGGGLALGIVIVARARRRAREARED